MFLSLFYCPCLLSSLLCTTKTAQNNNKQHTRHTCTHVQSKKLLVHLLHKCGTIDENDIMHIALVNAFVTEALLHGTRGIAEIQVVAVDLMFFDI